jgi:Uma2 family endonuclease
VVPGVGVRISTPWRTGLIPDIVVLVKRADSVAADATDLVLAVEVWSPGNTRTERETKMAAYAGVGVPFFWAFNRNRTVTAYYLKGGQHVEELTAEPGTTVTIKSAPVPVTFDPAEFSPR